ncbi:hypothetical protein PANT_7d00326 [Moesziomyces antarcticus T-34]|uniref:Uncharacterized protein n=1 Tax=Pseudozyma antarctica (strain T-34) TaxID=1151754 RepID=M9MBR9_PSEA3|nr:hypothetical protein PANT_7d00326 [Moesziomyces antarcticus T-34]
MLAVPTPSTSRFQRSLYDVDRTKPSPFAWTSDGQTRRYVRRMGLIESFFNTMATLHEGRTDIFYRIPLSCPTLAYEHLARRLPLVWAILCRRHPLLGAHVETLTPGGTRIDAQQAAATRHTGEAADDGSISFEPHFVFDVIASASDLLESASKRVAFLPPTWCDDPELRAYARGSNATRSGLVVSWLDRYVWNGKRRFLEQTTPFGLAQLILLPPAATDTATDSVDFDLVLCSAHCISDGLSISDLAGELVRLLASSELPIQLPELEHRTEPSVGVPGLSTARYAQVSPQMKHAVRTGLLCGRHQDGGPNDDGAIEDADWTALLPAPIEAAYPELLPPAASTAGAAGSSAERSRLARARWFWTIRRVVVQIRAAKAESAVLSDFKANRTDKSVEEPWWGAQTRWSAVRLSAEDTSALTRVAKRKGVRVGSLLYSVAACALNTLELTHTPPGSRSEEPTSTVMGFPFSIRRFLAPAAADTHDPLLVPSSLGVKLSFNGIGLPPASLFSLNTWLSGASEVLSLSGFECAQLWQTARQVQRQFNAIFHEPRFMHADGFLTALEREMRFRKNGVKDVFQVFKDDAPAGADERTPGLAKKNMQGPGSSLNFSMVGLLDTVLPSRLEFVVPSADVAQAHQAVLEVRDDLLFGVRTRAGEAFGTSFTFRGQLNLELGHDTVVWDTNKVLDYLGLMKTILEALVAADEARGKEGKLEK